MNILTNLDVQGYVNLNKNELRNAQIQNLGTAPSSPVGGQIYFDTGSNKLRIYNANAASWQDYYTSTTTLDAIQPPSFDVDVNSKKITNLATPTNAGDAANKSYVDGLAQGVSYKNPVRAATTGNITLSGTQTVDGVSVIAGDRVLVKDQSTGSQNGIYLCASGSWTRATDADTGAEMLGATVFISEGTANGNDTWTCTTDAPITLGTTSISFVMISANKLTYSSGVQKSGNAISANVDGVTVSVNGSNQLQVVSGTVSRIYSGTISGNGSATSFPITHSLGTKKVEVMVYGTSSPYSDQLVGTEVTRTSTSVVTIGFSTAPASGVNFDVIVMG